MKKRITKEHLASAVDLAALIDTLDKETQPIMIRLVHALGDFGRATDALEALLARRMKAVNHTTKKARRARR